MRAVAVFANVSTGTGTKTLVQIQAGTDHAVRLTEASISFDGIDNLAEPVIVELLVQTTAGTASVLTPVKVERTDATNIDAAAQETFTAEPTASDVLRRWKIHPQTGFTYSVPDPAAFEIASAERLGMRVIMPSGATAVEAVGYLEWEE